MHTSTFKCIQRGYIVIQAHTRTDIHIPICLEAILSLHDASAILIIKIFFFLPCTTSTNVLSPLSESNLQEENYNKMQDISSSPACSSQAGHTATEKPCSTIYSEAMNTFN